MKTLKRFREGEPIPDNAKFIKTETTREPLSSSELSDVSWPGLGPWPHRKVDYVWYEVQLEATSGEGE